MCRVRDMDFNANLRIDRKYPLLLTYLNQTYSVSIECSGSVRCEFSGNSLGWKTRCGRETVWLFTKGALSYWPTATELTSFVPNVRGVPDTKSRKTPPREAEIGRSYVALQLNCPYLWADPNHTYTVCTAVCEFSGNSLERNTQRK